MHLADLMHSADYVERMDCPTNPHLSMGTRSSSALHSIMEQGWWLISIPLNLARIYFSSGGLVELSAKRDDNSPVLTRTIGDPLTGTDAIPECTHEEASPTSANPESLGLAQHDSAFARPNYLKLPARQDFARMNSATSLQTSTSSTVAGQSPGHSSPPASPGYEHGIKVLVVDDDPLTRKLMTRMLTRIGCRVSTAENGEMALEMILGLTSRITPSSEETGSGGLSSEGGRASIRASTSSDEYKYSVIFLDNQMPVMSGLETVGKLRELGRHDFVVGVTGEDAF
jgi:osomolarity two-component system, sensor histidine kinase SLN1